jgi:hypothetical protein
VLVVDPRDLAHLDEVAFATGRLVHPIVVPEARVWALLRRTYGVDRHLRGIEVEFGKMQPRNGGGAEKTARAPSGVSGDLMEEGAFDALYSNVGRTPWPPLSAPVPPPATAAAPQERPSPSGSRVPPPAAATLAAALAAAQPALAAPAEPTVEEVVELTDLLVEPETVPTPALVPEVLAALSGAARPPPTWLEAPASPQEETEPSPLGFDEAVRSLDGVDDRNAIARAVLRYARSRFRRAVLLTVERGAARGWAGLGERLTPASVRRMQLALGTPGVLDTVVRTRAHFLGPLPKTEANIRLLKALGGGVPANAFLVPILALGRVVNVFYADNGRGGLVDAGGVGELLILATRIAKSYGALLERVR